MLESQFYELQRSLVPARIEADQTRIAGKLESPHGATRRQKTKHRSHAQTQAGQTRMDRKAGLVRVNRVLKPHIQHGLVPNNVGVERQLRSPEMRQLLVIG